LKQLLRSIYIPLAWTIFIQVLLCLPGNQLPSEGFFEIPEFDKIIHVIFFGFLVISWCYYFRMQTFEEKRLKNAFFVIFLLAATNGIVIEYIQFYFIPFRSFDKGDIIADLLSASVAYGFCNVKLLTCSGKTST
jgi:VanZ family protein